MYIQQALNSIYRVKEKLRTGELSVAGDQWPIFLYNSYKYDDNDPWKGLLQSSILVKASRHFLWYKCNVLTRYRDIRHSNIFLLLQVLWKEKLKQQGQEMPEYTAWLVWLEHPLHTLLHRCDFLYHLRVWGGDLFIAYRQDLLQVHQTCSTGMILQRTLNGSTTVFLRSLSTPMRPRKLTVCWPGGIGEKHNTYPHGALNLAISTGLIRQSCISKSYLTIKTCLQEQCIGEDKG